MICVTGSEPSPQRLAARLETIPEAGLQEVRLDLLEAVEPDAVRGLPARDRLIVTCRPRAEGGQWQGDEPSRLRLLSAALEAGARYVDLEANAPDETWQTLHGRFGSERLVASVHEFGRPECSPQALARLQRRITHRPASMGKLAVALDDVADLDGLRRLLPGDDRPLVRIGMGLAGQIGRVRYDVLGSPWTYVTAPHTEATAPGQLTWHDLHALRKRGAHRLLVLLGGPQVAHSPGPSVYNALAADEGLPWFYLAAPTRAPARALTVLDEFGLAGVSVTMPHKDAAAGLATRLEDTAARLGAVNTLVPDGHGGWRGHNTDCAGVVGALSGHLRPGAVVAVLGTGGAARAAVAGLTQAGHQVLVAGRRPDAVTALARHRGGTPVGLDRLHTVAFDALVNATPVGADGEGNPVTAPVCWEGKVVLDMVLWPRQTPLLRQVQQQGGVAVEGFEMWVHQGAAQWALFTGRTVSPEALLALAEDAGRGAP